MTNLRAQEDSNVDETKEWLASLEYILENQGTERANFLLARLSDRMTKTGTRLPYTITTAYRNTIPSSKEAFMPGDLFMERRIRSLIRWNALAMVVRANNRPGDLGGHISSFASSATLYDVGFNYFFRGPEGENPGDLIYFQGHAAEDCEECGQGRPGLSNERSQTEHFSEIKIKAAFIHDVLRRRRFHKHGFRP